MGWDEDGADVGTVPLNSMRWRGVGRRGGGNSWKTDDGECVTSLMGSKSRFDRSDGNTTSLH